MRKITKKNRTGGISTAVIYARYSCDKQSEQSIEGQLEVCERYAKDKSLLVIHKYIDRAISGRTDDRPQFMQMIQDSAKGEFDYVIVYKLDRFSRNRYNSAMYKNKLKQNGVAVLSAMENLSDGPESVMLEAMLEGMAEYYSLELSQKVKRGMAVSASKGNSVGGLPPLGYEYGADKKLHIVEREAEAVRIAYDMYAKGKGKKEIAAELNAKGYRTKTGKHFTINSFGKILCNIKYTGDYAYNGEITAVGGCPQIISKDLYDRVQEMAKRKSYAPAANRSDHKYPLSGKVFCGVCGAPMTGYTGTSRNGVIHHYYSCNNHRYKRTCHKRNEIQDFIDWFVTLQTKAMLCDKEFIAQFSEAMQKYYDREYGNKELENTEAELCKTTIQINNLISVISSTGNAALVKHLEELQEQQKSLQIRVQELRISSNAAPTADEIRRWFEQFDCGDENSSEYREHILSMLVNSVYVTEDEIYIIWNTGKDEKITFEEFLEQKEKTSAEVLANVNTWLPPMSVTRTIVYFNHCILASFKK